MKDAFGRKLEKEPGAKFYVARPESKLHEKKEHVAKKMSGIGVGVGYKDPKRTNKKGELIGGIRYEYPIKDKKHLEIIKSAGGEYKLHKHKK